MSNNGAGSVLIIGGGISGSTVALEAAEAGCGDITLIERSPSLGGRVADFNRYFPKLCPPVCGLEINHQRLRRNPGIRVITLAEVESLSGSPGEYRATIRVRPRLVNERCTAGGECVAVCPVERPNERNYGLDKTKAVYLPHASAWPARYVIDPAACPGKSCAKCVEACKYGAIDLEMKEEKIELRPQAVVVATGWKPYDAEQLELLGAGKLRNVVTNVVMERLAAPDGPTAGKILRPSDSKEVKRIAFVQCAGSRDENHLPYCSAVCCSASLKQATYVREAYPEAEIHLFYIDIRTPGRMEGFYAERQKDEKLKLIKGKVAEITEDAATGDVTLTAEDALTAGKVTVTVDLAVLATGIVPVAKDGVLPEGAKPDENGFLSPNGAGIIVVGCARRPEDVSSCVKDATGAALRMLQITAKQD